MYPLGLSCTHAVQEIDSKNTSAVNLLRSEACTPDEVASKVPEKSPAYVFYSFPTPPPPKPIVPVAAPAPKASPASARNTFQASQGGARQVDTSDAPRWNDDKKSGDAADEEEEKKDEEVKEDVEEEKEEPAVEKLEIAEPEQSPVSPPSPVVESKGRVLFIYWCPSGSPVRFRMVYSTTVRGIQQDAMDKAGCEIIGKLETSDKSDLAGPHIREAVPSRPKHASSLPTPAARIFGVPAPAGASFGAPAPSSAAPPAARSFATPGTAPVFGAPAPAGFGRPKPVQRSQTATPDSAPATPVSASAGGNDTDDSQERIRSAFDAFGPRVNAGGGGFSRPRPAGRR